MSKKLFLTALFAATAVFGISAQKLGDDIGKLIGKKLK